MPQQRAASAGRRTDVRVAKGKPVRFRATLELGGKTATGITVPDGAVAALGPGRRHAVRVTIGRHTYRSTVAPMGGSFKLPVSAENRAAAGVAAGDALDVTLEPDTEPRTVTVSGDLAAALAARPGAREAFDALAPGKKKWLVAGIEGAKAPETRARRIAKAVASLA